MLVRCNGKHCYLSNICQRVSSVASMLACPPARLYGDNLYDAMEALRLPARTQEAVLRMNTYRRPARGHDPHARPKCMQPACSSAPARRPPSRAPARNAYGVLPAAHAVRPPVHEHPSASIPGRQLGARKLCDGAGTSAMARRGLLV